MPAPNRSLFGFVSWWLMGTLLVGGGATSIVVLMCVANGATVTDGLECTLIVGYGGPPLELTEAWRWLLLASLSISAIAQLLLVILVPVWILLATWQVYVGTRSGLNR
jgi:hypothetical protein